MHILICLFRTKPVSAKPSKMEEEPEEDDYGGYDDDDFEVRLIQSEKKESKNQNNINNGNLTHA